LQSQTIALKRKITDLETLNSSMKKVASEKHEKLQQVKDTLDKYKEVKSPLSQSKNTFE
jgi:hypothetical protein